MLTLDSSVLRVAVGAADGPQSGTWRIWVNKSDLYVAMRAVASLVKVSLHSGGRCNLAFTTELAASLGGETAFPDQSRRVDSWRRPEFISTGLEVPLQLHFPTSELRTGKQSDSVLGQAWLPPAPLGFSRVLLIAYGPDLSAIHTVAKGLTSLDGLAMTTLPNGETVHLLHGELQTEGAVYQAIARKRVLVRSSEPRFRVGRAVDPLDPGSRLLVTGTAPTGQRIFVDAACS